MTLRSLWAGAAAAALALTVSTAANAACQLAKIAEVPVVMRGLVPTVAAQLNGKDTTFTIDTGAVFSVVTSDAKTKFEMRKSMAPYGAQVRGVGGASRDAEAARADKFALAGMGFPNIDFLVGGRFGGGDIAGVVGQNIMGVFDVEYDFANGVMRVFKASDCKNANLAYWSSGMAVSRIDIDEVRCYTFQVILPAYVNGHRIHLQMDTGSPLSFLSLHAAERAGVQVSSEGVEGAGLTYGAYGGGIETYVAPFASFKIGDEEIKNTRLRMSKIDLSEGIDMLLGADFFLSHRVLISNSQKKVYFTYNGGPVFRLDRNGGAKGQAQAQAGPAPADAPGAATASAGAAPPAAGEVKLTASEHARRAAALAARRDYGAAIAEYTQAIDLDPNDASAYRARAQTRLLNRQPVLAMADLDEAVKKKPDDVQTLMLRAELFMQNHDKAHGQADVEAAQKLAPADAELQARIALAYARGDFYDEAVQKLDAWIAAHPRSDDIGQALGARCWIRARSGKGLDAALADCDQALRKDRNSVVMTYRGLVLLRMGRNDEALAQYAAVLKVQPRSAAALYGRGLVELRKGDKAQGDADIAAATAISPEVARDLQRFGVGPQPAPAPAPVKAGS